MRSYCPDCGGEPLACDESGFDFCTSCGWSERDLYSHEEIAEWELLAKEILDNFHDRCEHGIPIDDYCAKCDDDCFTCVECGVMVPIANVIDGFCLRCYSELLKLEEGLL